MGRFSDAVRALDEQEKAAQETVQPSRPKGRFAQAVEALEQQEAQQVEQPPAPQQAGTFTNAVRSAGEFAVDAAGAVRDSVVGVTDEGNEEIPELRGRLSQSRFEGLGDRPRTAGTGQFAVTGEKTRFGELDDALKLVRDDAVARKVIEEDFADLNPEFSVDEASGNEIVTLSDGSETITAFVNKPGISQVDAERFAADAGVSAAAVAPAGRAVTTLGRLGKTFLGLFGSQVGQDVAQRGEVEDVRPGQAALVSLVGTAIDKAAPQLVQFGKRIFGNRQFVSRNGALNDAGRQAFRDAGIDPDTISDDLASAFISNTDDLADPAAAARGAQLERFGIQPTRGQATQNPAELAFESRAAANAEGRRAGEILGDTDVGGRPSFGAQQADQVAQSVDDVQRVVGTNATDISAFRSESEAVEFFGTQLKERARLLDDQIQAAYSTADAARAEFTGGSLQTLSKTITSGLKDRTVSRKLTPQTTQALNSLKKFTRRARGKRIRPVTLKEFETFRRELNAGIEAAATKTDRGNLINMKRSLDNWLEGAFDDALFSGDQEALDLMIKARGLRRQYGELFEPQNKQDAAGKVILKIIDRDANENEIANWMIGQGKVGSKEVTARVAGRLKNIFGAESEEFGALQEAVMLRLARRARSTTGTGKTRVSPQTIVSELDEFLDGKGASVARELYDEQKLQVLREYRDALRLLIPPKDAVSTSRSDLGTLRGAEGLFRVALTGMGFFTGGVEGAIAGRAISGVPAAVGGRRAAAAARGVPKIVPSSNPVLVGAGANLLGIQAPALAASAQ